MGDQDKNAKEVSKDGGNDAHEDLVVQEPREELVEDAINVSEGILRKTYLRGVPPTPPTHPTHSTMRRSKRKSTI
jgi:hypothetical protein